MIQIRPNKPTYYLDIAKAVAKRSTCLQRQYCAVIVNNDEIIATGYNGAARGQTDCLERGSCWREENDVPHGEQNAIISASRAEMIGGTLYLAGFENGKEIENPMPCVLCARMIMNAGINRFINNTMCRSWT